MRRTRTNSVVHHGSHAQKSLADLPPKSARDPFGAIIFAIAVISIDPATLQAQQAPTAVYVTGNAAVTGFSGTLPPAKSRRV